MFSRLFKQTKHFSTAVALLLLCLVGAEVWLRMTTTRTVACVTQRVPAAAQSVIVPSATVHHEMHRLAKLQIGAGPQFETNSLGLRGPEPTQEASAAGLRVIVLGDDTVLGATHADDQTIPALLQRYLEESTAQKVEVINAGVPGYCPLLSLVQFRETLADLNQ